MQKRLPSQAWIRTLACTALVVSAYAGSALTGGGALEAQRTSDAGSPIRIYTTNGDSMVQGRMVSMSASELVYESPAGEQMRMDRRSVEWIEILRERGRGSIGFAVGAMAGAMTWGIVSMAIADSQGLTEAQHANIAFTPLTGGAVGGLAGWLFGRTLRFESWEPVVVLESLGRPGGGGLGMGVRMDLGWPEL